MNASLYLLMATIRLHLQNYVESNPSLVSYVLRNLYVDDLIGGVEDVDSGLKRYKELKRLFWLVDSTCGSGSAMTLSYNG